MDYSKHNNEKKRKKIRSNAAKSRKKVSFNIFRFTVLAILLLIDETEGEHIVQNLITSLSIDLLTVDGVVVRR